MSRRLKFTLGGAAAMLLLIVGAIAFSIWHTAQPLSPMPDRDTPFNKALALTQPEGEDAWPLLRDLLHPTVERQAFSPEIRAAAEELQQNQFKPLSRLSLGDWHDPALAPGKRQLERIRPLLTVIDEAVRQPAMRITALDPRVPLLEEEWPIPGFLWSLHMADRVNTVALRDAAERGDWDDALARLRTGLALSNHLMRQPQINILGIGQLDRERLIEECLNLLSESRLPAPVAIELVRTIEAAEPPQVNLLACLETERHLARARADAVYQNGLPLRKAAFAVPHRTAIQRVDHRVDEVIAFLRASDAPLPPEFDGPLALDRSGDLEVRPLRNLWIVRRAQKAPARMAAMLAALRVHLFRLEHGRLPATLIEAMPPEDALNPSTGEPFEYIVHGSLPEALAEPGERPRGDFSLLIASDWSSGDRIIDLGARRATLTLRDIEMLDEAAQREVDDAVSEGATP